MISKKGEIHILRNYGAWIVDNMHANLVKKSKPFCEEEFSKIRHKLRMIWSLDDFGNWWLYVLDLKSWWLIGGDKYDLLLDNMHFELFCCPKGETKDISFLFCQNEENNMHFE